LSSQNVGAAISVSMAASRRSLPGTSKMPPELVHAARQLADLALEIAEHLRRL
jgi:DNA-binding IclR family transcriptional regulator